MTSPETYYGIKEGCDPVYGCQQPLHVGCGGDIWQHGFEPEGFHCSKCGKTWEVVRKLVVRKRGRKPKARQ
jgi:hypothetical protein